MLVKPRPRSTVRRGAASDGVAGAGSSRSKWARLPSTADVRVLLSSPLMPRAGPVRWCAAWSSWPAWSSACVAGMVAGARRPATAGAATGAEKLDAVPADRPGAGHLDPPRGLGGPRAGRRPQPEAPARAVGRGQHDRPQRRRRVRGRLRHPRRRQAVEGHRHAVRRHGLRGRRPLRRRHRGRRLRPPHRDRAAPGPGAARDRRAGRRQRRRGRGLEHRRARHRARRRGLPHRGDRQQRRLGARRRARPLPPLPGHRPDDRGRHGRRRSGRPRAARAGRRPRRSGCGSTTTPCSTPSARQWTRQVGRDGRGLRHRPGRGVPAAGGGEPGRQELRGRARRGPTTSWARCSTRSTRPATRSWW